MVNRKNLNYSEIILKTIAVTGILSIALLAPNALQMFSFLRKNKSRATYRIKTRVQNLLDKGYLIQTKKGVKLGQKGRLEILKYTDLKLKKPKRWNGKWILVSFDFEHKRRKFRDLLRFHLKRIGFVKLQHSIWIFPYECEDLIELIKTEMDLKKEVVYIRASSISNESHFKKLFVLK